jgi:hypothetical protein
MLVVVTMSGGGFDGDCWPIAPRVQLVLNFSPVWSTLVQHTIFALLGLQVYDKIAVVVYSTGKVFIICFFLRWESLELQSPVPPDICLHLPLEAGEVMLPG